MGRAPCCSKVGLHRGPWSPREDTLLIKYIQAHGEGNWRSMPKKAGLLRCGKSCRLRWMNYLRPDIKRGNITADEDDVIIRMHSLLGNRWSLIAGRLPGRTDNEIKNYWNTHLRKRLTSQGIHPNTHKKLPHRPPQQKQNKRRRKKDTTTTTNNKFAKLLEPEKSNIYLPKPVRLTSSSLPRNNSFNFNYQEGETTGLSAEGNSWCNFKEISFLDGNVDHDFVNCSDLEFLKILEPTNNSNLEKLYDEYLQLLKSDDNQVQFDSSAESLSL